MVTGIALVRTVLRVADLGEARWQSQILCVDGIDHVRWGQASSLQFDRIDVDHDLPILAATAGPGQRWMDRRSLRRSSRSRRPRDDG